MSIVLFGSCRLANGFCSAPCTRGFFTRSSISAAGRQNLTSAIRSLTSGKPPSASRFEKIIKVVPKEAEPPSRLQTMIKNFLGPKPMPERHTAAWYGEMLLICTVFAITGSSTMLLVSSWWNECESQQYFAVIETCWSALNIASLYWLCRRTCQVRPAVKDILGIQGSFRDGPWSYRICSLVIMSPIYAVLLVGVGTVFGRHFYFRRFSIKIISRFGIPPESLDKNWYQHEKHFRKW